MENLRAFGNPVGEYVGDGNGESGSTLEEDVGKELDNEESLYVTQPDDTSTADAHPLLFFFDCETTSFSIYNDHITEIAAKVIAVPHSSTSRPTYESGTYSKEHPQERLVNYNIDQLS